MPISQHSNANRLPVVAAVDNTNPDNLFQVMMLLAPQFDLRGVVVTGRAAADNEAADLRDISPTESERRTLLNTVRMRNFIDTVAPRKDVPVYMGTPAPETIVPHKIHVDERDFGDLLDGQEELIWRDDIHTRKKLGAFAIAGTTEDLCEQVAGSDMPPFSLIVGGPMTDVAKLMADPAVLAKTTDIHTQFGMCGFGEQKLMEFGDRPRGKRQFNVACDVVAADTVLRTFPRAVYCYPSDVTRVDAIGFASGMMLREFLADTPANRHMCDIYDYAFTKMIEPRGPHEKIWIHDGAPAIGSANLPVHGRLLPRVATEIVRGPYVMRPVDIKRVPHDESERASFGEIWLSFVEDPEDVPDAGRRYFANHVDPKLYKEHLYKLTEAIG